MRVLLRRETGEPTGIDDAIVDDEQFEVLVTGLPSEEFNPERVEAGRL